ncbi:MAG: DegV family protein [Anaerolineaceae bacterium]|nr:DegV family protein [Anaerolineaceae bacterium]MBQ6492422.1 DegV family protein [Erysipelotrichaceae bacterium]
MRIVADSSCDLFTLDYEDFITVPLSIYTDKRSFTDDETLNVTEMLDYLAKYKGRSYTSCPPIDLWKQAYEGADEIFVMTVTSALSGSYMSALNAAEMYLEEHPSARISVIDSLSTGAEEVLALNKLVELIKEGKDFETIDQTIRTYLKKSRLFFSFFSLHNLSQNGRVNKAVSLALTALNIAVTGTATAEGKIDVTGKARGEKKSLQTLFKDMTAAGYKGGKAIITHTENEEAAVDLKKLVQETYPDADIKIVPTRGLCSYYMERRGVVISCETE